MAQQVLLQPAELLDATGDIEKAHSIRQQARFKLVLLPWMAPEGPASRQWQRYRDSFAGCFALWRQICLSTTTVSRTISGVPPVPVTATNPEDKLVAIIDLGKCLPCSGHEDDDVTYPDPILLFQLIAEADPTETKVDLDCFDEVHVPSDEKSCVSGLSATSMLNCLLVGRVIHGAGALSSTQLSMNVNPPAARPQP